MLFTEYFNILHHIQAMKKKFLKLFLISMFKNPNLADIFTNLTERKEKKKKKLNPTEFIEFVFSKS